MGRGGGGSSGGGGSHIGGGFYSRSSSSGSFSSRGSGSSSGSRGGMSSSSSSSSSRGGLSSGSSYRPSTPRPTTPRPSTPTRPRSYYDDRSDRRTEVHNTTIFTNVGNTPSFGGSPPRYNNTRRADYGFEGYDPDKVKTLDKKMFLPVFIGIMSILIIFILLVWGAVALSKPDVSVSTVDRQKLLSSDIVESTEWYEDTANWISNDSALKKGMIYFFQKTGVQPYLIINKQVNGKGKDLTDEEARDYMESEYDRLFTDKGHMIVMFTEYADSQYYEYIYTGNKASTVIDDEARNIILDYMDYYYTSDLEDEAYFSTVFQKSADRLMEKSTSKNDVNRSFLRVVGLLGAITIIGCVVYRAGEQKRLKAEADERILNTPLDRL